MSHMDTTRKVAVFVSHTSGDDPFVRDLSLRLERRKYIVYEDSTAFCPGDDLPKEVKEVIDRNGMDGTVERSARSWAG